MAEGHIVLDGVRKSFGPKHVLNGINLSVPKGHSLVVIGGSGTGKSVMLKCILGIIQPDAGSIRIGGEEVVGLTGKARDAYLSRARRLMREAPFIDTHNDLPEMSRLKSGFDLERYDPDSGRIGVIESAAVEPP